VSEAREGGGAYIYWLTDEYMRPHVRPGATAPSLHIFVGDVAPMSVAPYICQCHVTEEYNLKLSAAMNTLGYARWRYLHQCIHWLIDDFMLYLSV
jgi:hypothetical protein